jgi:hypothetical protein
MGQPMLDLMKEPLRLNERFRVTADGLQWIVQKRYKDDKWINVIYCQTKAGLGANLGYEVYRVGEIDPRCLGRLESDLPWHRKAAPGYIGGGR